MGRDTWVPDQYERFAAQRAQPFWDLADLVGPGPIERAVDLGCGTGELTAALVEYLAIGQMVGVDSSPAMLERTADFVGPRVRFEQADIAEWSEASSYDLVFANASLHWVPDHERVLGRWAASLRAGGRLAVQVPANADHASHVVAVEVAHSAPFLDAMGGSPPADPVASNVLAPDRYASLLHGLGFADPDVRLQVYGHVLDSSADVVEWVRGTSLTRFFAVLPPELHEPFVEAYRARLLDRIGESTPYFYPFKRILMCATRTG